MRICCPQKASKEKTGLEYEGFTPHTVGESAPLSAKSDSRRYTLPGVGRIWYVKAVMLGHSRARLEPKEVIEVTPKARACGQTEFPVPPPYYTQQVIELPEIQMVVKHIILHETCCPRCSRRLTAELPTE
jgi:hypothetical protein